MRIFVTGSSGFIGKALAKDLEAHGHSVCGYDTANHWSQNVIIEDYLNESIDRDKPDVVIHLAAEVGKLNCEQVPEDAVLVNVIGTLNVAKACSERGIPLVYCSTSEVYGDFGPHVVVDETFQFAYGSSGVYALSKRFGEDICRSYAPKGLKILRPCMPVGPGVPPGPGRRALDNLVWQALTGKPMVVHRGAARSWCWVDDIASGVRTVIEKGAPGIYNVGRDDDEISMESLAYKICNLVDDDNALYWTVKQIDPPARQTAVKRISCQKLRDLGWEPKTSLDEGLPLMVAWIKEWIETTL